MHKKIKTPYLSSKVQKVFHPFEPLQVCNYYLEEVATEQEVEEEAVLVSKEELRDGIECAVFFSVIYAVFSFIYIYLIYLFVSNIFRLSYILFQDCFFYGFIHNFVNVLRLGSWKRHDQTTKH